MCVSPRGLCSIGGLATIRGRFYDFYNFSSRFRRPNNCPPRSGGGGTPPPGLVVPVSCQKYGSFRHPSQVGGGGTPLPGLVVPDSCQNRDHWCVFLIFRIRYQRPLIAHPSLGGGTPLPGLVVPESGKNRDHFNFIYFFIFVFN